MDNCEKSVYEYLLSINIGQVTYEPDRNIPPDFLIEGNIAVEARRLNQNFQNQDGSTKGLEDDSIPLWQKIEKLLQSYGPATNGQCWYVGIDFSRPIGSWKQLEFKIQNTLNAFILNPPNGIHKVQVSDNFAFDFIPSGTNHVFRFFPGAISDDDSGGSIFGLLKKNLQLCVTQKEIKIAPYKNRYPSWWLVMTDHISFSLDKDDRAIFNNEIAPTIQHSFGEIILLDPRDYRRSFRISCSNQL